MNIYNMKDATRVLGTAQGYRPLPIRDGTYEDGTMFMISSWVPTTEELAKLNRGETVKVTILGREHPPIMVGV